MSNNKSGFNYYSVDTDRYMDIRIKRLKKDYGCRGLAVYDYILCDVYRVRGCFSVWDESTAFDVAEYFGLRESVVNEIVGYCGVVGLFDKELLARGIITSAAIQRRYIEMSRRARRQKIVIPEECRILTEECPIITEESAIITEVCDKVKKSKDITPYVVISSSSSSSMVRTREEAGGEDETGTGGITSCAQEALPRRYSNIAPEKSCAKKVPPPPASDGTCEYIPVTAIAEYLTGDEVWLEALCMNKHLDRAYVEAKIRDFAAECQNSGETAKDKRDCKRHFNNWLRKRQEYEQTQRIVRHERGTKNQPPSPDELARAVAAGISRAHTRQEWE